MESPSYRHVSGRVIDMFIDVVRDYYMAEMNAHDLAHWCEKIVNDPEMLPEDQYGHKLGDSRFDPPIAKTYCNIAVQRICRGLGYSKFENMTANQIYDFCIKNLLVCDEMSSHSAAMIGDIVLSAWKNDKGHGHVAVLYPDRQMVYSGKWRVYCPKVANVGKNCGIMGSNYAFSDKPSYFRTNTVTT